MFLVKVNYSRKMQKIINDKLGMFLLFDTEFLRLFEEIWDSVL